MTSKRFLLAIWEGGGNVPPQLSIARALTERGHHVRVLADELLAPDVAAAGAAHVPWSRAPQRRTAADPDVVQDTLARTPPGQFARIRDRLLVGPAAEFAADALAELEREPVDAFAPEALLLGALIAGEAARVPTAALAPNVLPLPGWGVPPFGPGFAPARGPLGRVRDAAVSRLQARMWDRALPVLNAARAAHGLAPLGGVLDQIAAPDRVLILTSRAFEYPQFAPPAHVRIVGPRLDDPAWVAGWTPPPGGEPLVLVALSTTFQDQLGLVRRAAEALGSLPVRAVLTTGPRVAPEDVAAPPNVTVVRAAPHGEVLRHAAAVVTHGGHGTTIKALAAGVPVVVLPMGRDQPETAARVVAAGAGVRLRPGAPAKAIARAVRRVLDEPAHRAGAERLAAAIARETAHDAAVAELEALAGAHAAAAPAAV